MKKRKKKIIRTAELISILSKYGFNEFLIQTKLRKPEDFKIYANEDSLKDNELGVYERIRMAIEDLGVTFIKLGQTFSNREDLLPEGLIVELKKLQDEVEPISLDIHKILKDELEIETQDYFRDIDTVPIASASISQVYRATLLDGKSVILKIKRPSIKEQVESDLLLMKDIAKILIASNDNFKKIRLLNVIESFEKSIFEEMSFYNEINNIEQFARNFKDNTDIFTIHSYSDLSNDSVLCMDFVDGMKITDKDILIENRIDPIVIAKKGLDLYLTQVIEYGFFHADPHPGNIFVMIDGKIAFIDFGSMGRLLPKDKELLEDFIVNFISKDSKRLIRTIKKMALELKIKDEAKLERDISGIFEILDSDSLENINLKEIMIKFAGMLNSNDVLMPEYMYLLIRGVVLIEGIGRELDPSMNIIEGVKPYINKIIFRRLNPEYLLKKGTNIIRDIGENFGEFPENLNTLLKKINEGEIVINKQDKDLNIANRSIATALNRLAFTVLICGFCIASSLLIMADKPPYIFSIPAFGLIGIAVSGILSIIVLLSIFKKEK